MEAKFCDVCRNGHDYKTSKILNKHANTPLHKRKFDPEFAAAEANKATRGEKERYAALLKRDFQKIRVICALNQMMTEGSTEV